MRQPVIIEAAVQFAPNGRREQRGKSPGAKRTREKIHNLTRELRAVRAMRGVAERVENRSRRFRMLQRAEQEEARIDAQLTRQWQNLRPCRFA